MPGHMSSGMESECGLELPDRPGRSGLWSILIILSILTGSLPGQHRIEFDGLKREAGRSPE